MKKEYLSVTLSYTNGKGYDTKRIDDLREEGWEIDYIVTPGIGVSTDQYSCSTIYGRVIYHMSKEVENPTQVLGSIG